MPFWNPDCFDFSDAINGDIWEMSPVRQQGIQQPATIDKPGTFGAQQAMLTAGIVPSVRTTTILPWVPDLVGKKWRSEKAVFVVGSAYAGFIKEYSGRGASMNLCSYATANSASQFQERFLKDVVQPDQKYYGTLGHLFNGMRSAEELCLLDLCRASFVRRRARANNRTMDTSKEPGANRGWDQYYPYMIANDDWTMHRIEQSQTTKLVALGWLAERGLLRFFNNAGCQIHGTANEHPLPHRLTGWDYGYVSKHTLRHWMDPNHFWVVTGTLNGKERKWHVLPVYHPSTAEANDPGYSRTRASLEVFLAAR